MRVTSRHWRFLRIAAVLALSILITIGIVLGAFQLLVVQHFRSPPPNANYPKPRDLLEAQKQDLDYFRKLMALDRSYSREGRARAEAQLVALEKLNHSVGPATLKVAVMQMVAHADNGHSAVYDSESNPPALIAPIRVTPFSDGFYVMRAKQPYRALLGGRVIAIDGVAFEKVLKQLETLQGGNEGWRRGQAATLIVNQDILHGLGIAHDAQLSSWTVMQPDGKSVTVSLRASPLRGSIFGQNPHWLSPQPLGLGNEWLAYSPATGRLPESYQDYGNRFALIRIPNSCAVDIRLRTIVDTRGQKIVPFLLEAEAALRAHPPCGAIVDLRGNPGGNYDNARQFSYNLPKLVAGNGPIYVLTDGQTFSAAIFTAAFLKNAGGARTKIIGEPVGDRLAFYAEGPRGCLPNSNLCFRYQVAKHDLAAPCLQRDCWWRDWFWGVHVKSLEPDKLIPRRFADWNKGHDVAYEWAVRAIGNHHQ